MKESWSLFTVKRALGETTLPGFNDCLKEKADLHYLMNNTAIKNKTEDCINPLNKAKVASKAFAANKQQKNHQGLQQFRQHLSQAALYARALAVGMSCFQGKDSHAARQNSS